MLEGIIYTMGHRHKFGPAQPVGSAGKPLARYYTIGVYTHTLTNNQIYLHVSVYIRNST